MPRVSVKSGHSPGAFPRSVPKIGQASGASPETGGALCVVTPVASTTYSLVAGNTNRAWPLPY
jgi:hypothetical protein